MPGYLMTQGSSLMCSHGGQAQATAPNMRVKANGQPVVTQDCTYTISGCPNYVGVSTCPCVTAQWITASLRIKAGGMPVLLQDSQSVTVPNGTGLNITSTQMRVKGE